VIILDKVKTVLVVDDEPDILRLVETVLTRAGHKVVTASNGERAIEKVRKMSSAPDLLLTDVVMPGLSGPMIAEQLREQFPTLKILFISAFEDRQVVRRYVKDPGYELISKPFHIEELSLKVQQLLDGEVPAGGGT
jgi:two-component system cell cycle sensor histidine kinase/response regulator CckA